MTARESLFPFVRRLSQGRVERRALLALEAHFRATGHTINREICRERDRLLAELDAVRGVSSRGALGHELGHPVASADGQSSTQPTPRSRSGA